MTTVSQLVRQATAQLTTAGCPSPETDSQLLVAFVLDVDRKELVGEQTLTDSQVAQTNELIVKRVARVPLQHLTGQAFFRHLTLQVGKGVFIPRPETELLAQVGLDALNKIEGPKLAVELCAGSGAIALSLALESPNTTVHAVELSKDAYVWLDKNVKSYADQLSRINSSVIIYHDDATKREVLAHLAGTVDVVLSNPPYIPSEMIPREPEVRDHDPHVALFGGPDGLDVAREVALVAAELLKPNGLFGFEHADVQGETSVVMLERQQVDGQPLWSDIKDNLDYNGLPRFTTALRSVVRI